MTTSTDHTKSDQFSYISHLQLDKLLSSLNQITSHPEEHLFITVHHSLEIWFKQIIFDLRRIVHLLEEDRLAEANWLLRRIGEIMRLADGHWTVLETMSAADFNEFRVQLTGASGMQSSQFREVEVLCGLCETAPPSYRAHVERAWPGMIESARPTLRQAFFEAIGRTGIDLPTIYIDRWRHFEAFSLCESVFELDRRFQTWRYNHILMVRRQIGMRTKGTGGTFGKDYLAATIDYLFFPELWELRHELAAKHGGEVAAWAEA